MNSTLQMIVLIFYVDILGIFLKMKGSVKIFMKEYENRKIEYFGKGHT